MPIMSGNGNNLPIVGDGSVSNSHSFAALTNTESNSHSETTSKTAVAPDWWLICEDFSSADLVLLRQSFQTVKKDTEQIVVTTFTRLFDNHPDAFSVFISRQVLPRTREEVAYSWETRRHGLRVMHAFERCLNRLHRPSEFAELIRRTAEEHVQFGVKPLDLLALLGCFKDAIIDDLSDLAAADSQSHETSELQKTPPSSPLHQTSEHLAEVSSDLACQEVGQRLQITANNSKQIALWASFFRVLGMSFVTEMMRSCDAAKATTEQSALGSNERAESVKKEEICRTRSASPTARPSSQRSSFSIMLKVGNLLNANENSNEDCSPSSSLAVNNNYHSIGAAIPFRRNSHEHQMVQRKQSNDNQTHQSSTTFTT